MKEIYRRSCRRQNLQVYNGNSFVTDTDISRVLEMPDMAGAQENSAEPKEAVSDTEDTDSQDGETDDET